MTIWFKKKSLKGIYYVVVPHPLGHGFKHYEINADSFELAKKEADEALGFNNYHALVDAVSWEAWKLDNNFTEKKS